MNKLIFIFLLVLSGCSVGDISSSKNNTDNSDNSDNSQNGVMNCSYECTPVIDDGAILGYKVLYSCNGIPHTGPEFVPGDVLPEQCFNEISEAKEE